ncbi:MAG: hypothetical protein ACOYKZ_06210 [Chlamydiia bacterium]
MQTTVARVLTPLQYVVSSVECPCFLKTFLQLVDYFLVSPVDYFGMSLDTIPQVGQPF